MDPVSRNEEKATQDTRSLEHDHDSTRRAFIRSLTGAVVVGLVVQIIGCTEADPVSSGPANAKGDNCPQPGFGKRAATDRTGTVGSNHGHVAIVTAAAQDAGVAYVLDITGTATHSHTVSFTAQDVANLKAGLAVTKQSSTTGHSHSVTFAAVVTSILPAC